MKKESQLVQPVKRKGRPVSDMSCANCGSGNVRASRQDMSEIDDWVDVYTCRECGNEWT